MLNHIRDLFRRAPRTFRRTSAPRPSLRVEALEDRRVMTTLLGSLTSLSGESILGGRTLGYSDINTIVQVSQPSGSGIRAEMFNASTGTIFRTVAVPGTDGINDFEPTIAVAGNGYFVVAWTHAYTGNFNDLDVHAQVFDAGGNAVGNTLWVASSLNNENSPSVGIDHNGNFAVAYTYAYSPTDHDVYVSMYTSSGAFLRSESVATSGHEEYGSSVDMNSSGQFVVAYTYDFSSSDQDVYANTYTASGALIRSTPIANSSQPEYEPSAAIDAYGDFVVSYTTGSNVTQVQARYVTANGLSQVAPISVGWAGSSEYQSSVDMASDGRFVIAYTYQYSATDSDVYAQEFTSTGGAIGGAFVVSNTANPEMTPSAAMDSAGDFAVGYAWIGANNTDWQSGNRYAF
jgi:hypothetical protein